MKHGLLLLLLLLLLLFTGACDAVVRCDVPRPGVPVQRQVSVLFRSVVEMRLSLDWRANHIQNEK